jgi:hypothetical protein
MKEWRKEGRKIGTKRRRRSREVTRMADQTLAYSSVERLSEGIGLTT